MAGMVKFRSIPLLLPTIFLCLGIISGIYLGQIEVWAIATFFALATAMLALLVGKRYWLPGIFIVLVFFLMGGLRATQVMWYYPNDHIIRYCQNDSLNIATIRGWISSEVRASESRGALARYDALKGRGVWFDLSVEQIRSQHGWVEASGIVRVYTAEPAINLALRDRIEVIGELYARSSADREYGNYLRRSRNITGLSVKHNEHIKIMDKYSSVSNPFDMFREKALSVFNVSNFEPGSDSDAIAAALLLGERQGISKAIKNDFLVTGTMHYLSLSGLHVSVLTAFVWLILRAMKAPRVVQGTLTIIFICVFMAIVPLRPPIVRAGVVMIVFCLGYISRRLSSPLNLLAFSAIILLFCRPLDIFDPGFQLSFAIVAALLILTPEVLSKTFSDPTKIVLREKYLLTLLDARPWHQQLISKINKSLFSALAISTVAWLMSFGLIAWHFNRVSWLGSLNSVVLAVPVTLAMFAGMLKLMLSLFSPIFDSLDIILEMPFKFLVYVNHSLASIPYSSENIPVLPTWLYMLYYLIIVSVLVLAYRKQYYWLKWFFCGLLLLIGTIIVSLPFCTAVDAMEIHALGVGHGCCIVIKMPGNRVIVYDAGSYDNFNLADEIVIPYCRKLGMNHIDALFVSHADLDHYNGIPELTSAIYTQNLLAPIGFESQFSQSDYDFVSLISQNNIEIRHLAVGDEIYTDEFNIKVIWPRQQISDSTNHGSLVMKVTCDNRSILLCGDITPQAIGEIVNSDAEIVADYVLLPHHGEYSNELKLLMEKTQSDDAILSARILSEDRINKLKSVVKNIHQPSKGQVIILK